MKTIKYFSFLLLSSVALITKTVASPLLPPPPIIHSVEVLSPVVELYDKFEIKLEVSAIYDNPYDYEQVAIQGIFVSPSGVATTVDGFYMQDYELETSNGSLSTIGAGEFRLRFAPDETGTWSFHLTIADATGNSQTDSQTFMVENVSSAQNHGFVRTSSTNYLSYDDGEQYIPIGENMAWQNSNAYTNYKSWLDGLADGGGNFIRLWHAHWGLGIEWENGNGFEGLRKYKQSNCYYQDWLYDYCAERGITVMLALQHHGPVSSQVNPNWNDSPYNVVNGGMCQNTIDFFTNEEARSVTQNRYRYTVARWGYSRSILCWELFNEVKWTDNFELYKDSIANWHIEMAAYLKEIDPQERIVTTSYGDDTTDENVWSHPDFDLTQSHLYLNVPQLEKALASANQNFLASFNKPTLNGEFGLGASGSLTNMDPDGVHLHNSIWGGLFSGALGTGMSWWWDSYIHPRDLYYHFTGVAEVADLIPFDATNMRPTSAYVEGAPAELSIAPTLGWGTIGTAEITIDENGEISPANAALALFLYGNWNGIYRSPPTFTVTFPQGSEFTVRTGSELSTNPRIVIRLDGVIVLDQAGVTDTDYTIVVPAGTHEINVDNTGDDWINIASYNFGDLGTQIDDYVLSAQDKSVITGYILNKDYNHQYLANNGEPSFVPVGTELVMDGYPNGANYTVSFFEPLTGALLYTDLATASNSKLYIPLPQFVWDLAFIAEGEPVGTKTVRKNLAFDVFPNPAKSGSQISLDIPNIEAATLQADLLDEAGRSLKSLSLENQAFRLPALLPAGMYWVRVQQGQKVGLQPLVIIKQ